MTKAASMAIIFQHFSNNLQYDLDLSGFESHKNFGGARKGIHRNLLWYSSTPF